jgi:DNA-binding MarR family transcriptional regulator
MQSASNNDSLPTYKTLDFFNPTSGGIALNAVFAMLDLGALETLVMIFFGSRTDFRNQKAIAPTVSKREISKNTRIGISTLKRILKSLVEKGYLYVVNNFDEDGFQLESTYHLTDYLFMKYAELSHVMFEGARREPPGGSERASVITSVAIPSEVDFPFSEEKENKINQISKNSRDREAEGEPRSLHQNDIHPAQFEQRTDSPMANTAHTDLDVDFSDTVSIKKSSTPKVTKWHRKMVLIFKPGPQTKSYVRDNDILFMTDEIFEKYGDNARWMIDDLYSWAKDNDKFGKLKWNPNAIWEVMEMAKNKLDIL